MEAVVLAGGFGTRLADVVSDVPKPMAPVCGRPFLRFVLDELFSQGCESVVLAVGHLHNRISEYFGSTYKGMRLLYSVEDAPLGTGGAIKQALGMCSEDVVIVLNGDSLFRVGYRALYEALYACPQAVAALAVRRLKRFDRYGSLTVEGGIISSFAEKSYCEEGLVNGGVYALKRSALAAMPPAFSIEHDYFERFVSDGAFVACESGGLFLDIGIPEDYERAQTVFLDLVPRGTRIAFFDRDGTINVDTGHLYEPEKLALIPSTVDLMRSYRRKGYRIVVVTNQAGIAKGLYAEEDMHRLHRILNEKLDALGAGVDAFYFCPHHPAVTGPCSCRKPAGGMVEKALFDFEADPECCVLYGDKETDLQAAAACGVRGVLVGA